MFDVGAPELLLIGIIALLVVGLILAGVSVVGFALSLLPLFG